MCQNGPRISSRARESLDVEAVNSVFWAAGRSGIGQMKNVEVGLVEIWMLMPVFRC